MLAGTNVFGDSGASFTPSGYLGLSRKSQLTVMSHGRVSNLKMLHTGSSFAHSNSFKMPTITHHMPRKQNVIMSGATQAPGDFTVTTAEKQPF